MKKIVMMAFAAALAFGMSGCATDDGGNGDNNGGLGADQAGLRISFTMPSSKSNTRAPGADEREEIDGTASESNVSNVHVFVFNNDADKTAPEMAWAQVPDVTTWFTNAPGSDTWTMNSGDAFKLTVSSGNAMRVWVGVNLPAGVGHKYPTEAAMLDALANVSAMQGANNFTMFSNVREGINLVKDETNTQLTAAGGGAVEVNRVVAKIIATGGAFDGELDWEMDLDANPGLGGDQPLMAYALTHWFIMQDAIQSYVAPRYNVNAYNGSGTYQAAYQAVHPITFKGTDALSSDNLKDYAASVATQRELADKTNTLPSDLNGQTIDNTYYIGENASLFTAPAEQLAKKGNTTYAFLSTRLFVDMQAYWDETAKDIKWQKVTTYPSAMTEEVGDDIWVIDWNGYEYFTKEKSEADKIRTNIAVREGAKLGIIVGDGPDEFDIVGDDPAEMEIGAFFTAHPTLRTKNYKYPNGYVHFIHWINKVDGTDNHYDILRNQFVHLDVTGLKNATPGYFPGYPGQDPEKEYDGEDGDPKIPIDPEDDDKEVNPDPIIPTEPVDPTKADLKVDIKIRPWTYRYNEVQLGR